MKTRRRKRMRMYVCMYDLPDGLELLLLPLFIRQEILAWFGSVGGWFLLLERMQLIQSCGLHSRPTVINTHRSRDLPIPSPYYLSLDLWYLHIIITNRQCCTAIVTRMIIITHSFPPKKMYSLIRIRSSQNFFSVCLIAFIHVSHTHTHTHTHTHKRWRRDNSQI